MSSDEAPSPPEEPRASALLEKGEGFPAADLCERWQREMIPTHDIPLFFRPSLTTTIDPDRWARAVEIRERELPEELFKDLRERTPQALLRDLHRPEQKFFVELQPIEGTEVIGQLSLEFEKMRRARRWEGRPEIEPIVNVFVEEQRRRRAFLAARWEPIFADDAQRKNVRIWQDQVADEPFYRPDFDKYGKK